jgi:membrane protease YdiL (CAAX protease family)
MTDLPPAAPDAFPPTDDLMRQPRPFVHRRTPAWLWAITLGVFGIVAVLQYGSAVAPARTAEDEAAARGETVPPAGPSALVLAGKLALLARQSGSAATDAAANKDLLPILATALGDPDAASAPAARAVIQPKPPPLPAAADRLRLAIIAAEVAGPGEALRRLDLIERDLAADSPLRDDVRTLRAVYARQPVAVADRDSLLDRHGWFARVALSHFDPAAEAGRETAAAEASSFLVLIAVVGLAYAAAFLAGVVLLVLALVWLAGGNARSGMASDSPRDQPGGRVWLETFALFVASFLLLKLILEGVAAVLGESSPVVAWAVPMGQWLLVLVLFWPLARGMPWARMRREVGWHSGRGLAREVAAGVAGYCAALPIFVGVAVVGVIVTLVYELVTGERQAPPMSKVGQMLGHSGVALRVALATLLVAWAPLVEETVFRGALYRHFRGRLGVPMSALLVGLFFALMHSYMPLQLALVLTLGVCFALLREWRGSLIAPMVAHAIQNSMALVLTLAGLRLMQP